MNHSRFIFPVLFIILLANCSNSESEAASTNIASVSSSDECIPFNPLFQYNSTERSDLKMIAQLTYSIVDCFGDSGIMEALSTGRKSMLLLEVGKLGDIKDMEAVRDTTFFTKERLSRFKLFLNGNGITIPLYGIPEEYGSAEEYFKENHTISYIFKFPPYIIFNDTAIGKTVTEEQYKELMAELEKFCQENSLRPKRVKRH